MLEASRRLAHEEGRRDDTHGTLDLRPVEEPTHLVTGQKEERTASPLHRLNEVGCQTVTPVVEEPPIEEIWELYRTLHTVVANSRLRREQPVDEGGNAQMLGRISPVLRCERRGRELTEDHPRVAQRCGHLGDLGIEEGAQTGIDLVTELGAELEHRGKLLTAEAKDRGHDRARLLEESGRGHREVTRYFSLCREGLGGGDK